MRNQIWTNLCNTQFKSYLFDIRIDNLQRTDRTINLIIAITSSGSIASWAYWQTHIEIWGAIIALSQVITAIRPLFPYTRYVKELSAKKMKLDLLSLDFQKLLRDFDNNKISRDIISTKYDDLTKELTTTLNFSDETIISFNKKSINKANEKMKLFFKTNYSISI